jgi:alkanesulfonate monooxygenase SsuD/methylene tetrahydromethanopterin reductase-like flavin-dependent oxidoreductase (luciferase family)
VPSVCRGIDEVLTLVRDCFEADEIETNGQEFLFLPRPERPPNFIGGAGLHALERTVAFGDGWLPKGGDPKKLK